MRIGVNIDQGAVPDCDVMMDPSTFRRHLVDCRPVAATRTFSFRAQADLSERHDRALAQLERLRHERPRLADSVRYDFDVRLAAAQERGLATPADRLRATVTALVAAVEQALADEPLLDREPPAFDDEALAAARAAADAAARRYEDEASAAG